MDRALCLAGKDPVPKSKIGANPTQQGPFGKGLPMRRMDERMKMRFMTHLMDGVGLLLDCIKTGRREEPVWRANA